MSWHLPDSPGARAETRAHVQSLSLFVVAIALAGLAAGLLAALLFGCAPAKAPSARATARGQWLAVAYGVQAARVVCVDAIEVSGKAWLSEECSRGIGVAWSRVIAAEGPIDSDRCLAAQHVAVAGRSLGGVLRALEDAGEQVPTAAIDGVEMATVLARTAGCEGSRR